MTTFSVKNDATTEVLSDLDMDAVSGTGTFATSKIALGIAGAFNGYVGASNPLPVTGTVAVTGTFWQATQPVSGTFWQATQPVSLASVPSHDVGTVTTVTTVSALTAITNALPAGDNNIGNVDVVTLPALPAGTNNIGDVDVLTLPALPAGTNNIGDVDIASIAAGDNNIGNVDIVSMPAVTVTGVSTLAEQQTQTTHLASIKTAVELQDDTVATHDSAATAKGTQTVLEARSTAPTAVSDGDAVRAQASLSGKTVTLGDSIPGLTWSYAAVAGGLVNTNGVTVKAAGAAGVRNYIKSVQVINSHATISTEVCIKDGASGTVLHRGYALANGGGYACTFNPPLRGSAATLVEIAEVTATGTAGVLVSLQGYEASE
jgi:hypothetical protein